MATSPVGVVSPHADDTAVVFDQAGGLGLHSQMKAGVLRALPSQEIEEVPLRHQRDKAAAGWQMREIGDPHPFAADHAGQVPGLLMRQLEKLLQPAEFADHVECRRMNRVAAKITEKILVLLHHDDVDAGARQQEATHHAGRATARDRAGGADRFRCTFIV